MAGKVEGKDEIVVFSVIRDSTCAECGQEIVRGDLLRLDGERALCLWCADLGHLVFLSRGDTALTRRASKHSSLRAVVLRFSRSRGRYERQGILVEEAALSRAESECLEDADARARARARSADRRDVLDAAYLAAFEAELGARYPGCPRKERELIAQHACEKHSGRVGRSAAAKELDPKAIELAVRAHVRHCHTNYDQLLSAGTDRHEARATVGRAVDQVLHSWAAGSQ